jgi:hypothetical protein
VPDLHGWITQQIAQREDLAKRAAHYGRIDWPQPATAVVDTGEDWPITTEAGPIAEHIADNDPATVLRRCTADRKILEVHKPYGGRGYGGHACTGCGELSEDWAVEHANDCLTLLALAEGYGLTPEILATLDRPVPEPYPPVRLSGPRPDTRRVPPALRGPNWTADR